MKTKSLRMKVFQATGTSVPPTPGAPSPDPTTALATLEAAVNQWLAGLDEQELVMPPQYEFTQGTHPVQEWNATNSAYETTTYHVYTYTCVIWYSKS